ncbi:MAG: hypothetical protein LUD72_05080 [Bacteroidales bacterium]|nr:hypothetical protein [Bacteroidales bacterium]
MEYKVKPVKSKCLECGDAIEYGRQDKKFCCDNCKNKFHNRRTRGSKRAKLKILSSLERNYSILDKLLKINVTSMSVLELQHLGFNFDCVTSVQRIRRHNVFLCFDISFTVIADRVTSITRLSLNLSSVPVF